MNDKVEKPEVEALNNHYRATYKKEMAWYWILFWALYGMFCLWGFIWAIREPIQ